MGMAGKCTSVLSGTYFGHIWPYFLGLIASIWPRNECFLVTCVCLVILSYMVLCVFHFLWKFVNLSGLQMRIYSRDITIIIVFFLGYIFGYRLPMWSYVLLSIKTPWELLIKSHWELFIPFGVILFRVIPCGVIPCGVIPCGVIPCGVIPFGDNLTFEMSVSHFIGKITLPEAFSIILATSCQNNGGCPIPQMPMYRITWVMGSFLAHVDRGPDVQGIIFPLSSSPWSVVHNFVLNGKGGVTDVTVLLFPRFSFARP